VLIRLGVSFWNDLYKSGGNCKFNPKNFFNGCMNVATSIDFIIGGQSSYIFELLM